MAERLAHRELRNRSSEILRDVQAGASYEITNHGDVVALLVPPQRRAEHGLRVRRATRHGGFSALRRVGIDGPAQEVLDDLRAEA